MKKVYRRCKRCVMDNYSDESIKFGKQGFCNYCSDVVRRKKSEYHPDGDKVGDIVLQIKQDCKKDHYDCMVGISGGIDSSYLLYLGHTFGLRMLAIHIDDGLDNPVAKENIDKLIRKTGADYITIEPNREEYADIILSLFKASVGNLAIVQDNLIIGALQKYGEKNHIKYSLDGANFAHESILERWGGLRLIHAIKNSF